MLADMLTADNANLTIRTVRSPLTGILADTEVPLREISDLGTQGDITLSPLGIGLTITS